MTTAKGKAFGHSVREMTQAEIDEEVKRIMGVCSIQNCAGRIGMRYFYNRLSSLGEPFATMRLVCPYHGALYAARHNVKIRTQELRQGGK